ncbi:Type 1 glutamine amidotransferase-like domain-containing protein [Gordonia rhizosphera]|uniref:Peptidase S51 family protein n=1 Tax=Gordonia rhizosphera NBRC 16068 TaxID=1108045 RepID=K6WA82_9ACTN|nr:Type 1 glutamine amidotransferase-like domain-containing protein [Gordonia rhizosphera]GAB89112.1 peptidase S51 family protein [Gordonia rhizosphera NBRC 16068]
MAELLLVSRWLDAVPEFVEKRVSGRVRVAFVPTASSIYRDRSWVDYDRRTLRGFGYSVGDLDIERLDHAGMVRGLDDADVVFVSGGNVFYLLAVMRSRGFADLLTERVEAGLPYVGVSAGACVVGADIEPLSLLDDPEEGAGLASTKGLGWIDEVVIPHADGIVCGSEVIDEIRTRYGTRYPLRFLTDDQALLVSGDSRSVVTV